MSEVKNSIISNTISIMIAAMAIVALLGSAHYLAKHEAFTERFANKENINPQLVTSGTWSIDHTNKNSSGCFNKISLSQDIFVDSRYRNKPEVVVSIDKMFFEGREQDYSIDVLFDGSGKFKVRASLLSSTSGDGNPRSCIKEMSGKFIAFGDKKV
ncbi:hypothetical protein [Pseudoalteromonas luteoviolacea]|uniref:hypothetical protein n=1 Tax=Pseudoalteromonas luteoviolacea TaxID=43657 RepID=UPI00114EAB75|nr:hypothetical protein [Pseudoalteromonas luteoviolacea]TQF71344.1 hypothetical protein FLM44_09710 [Pseudoalteromonas luteoviolacea]